MLAMAASMSARGICSNSASRQPASGRSSSWTTRKLTSRSTMAAASRSRSERSLDLRCASSATLKMSVASASKSSTASSSATASRVWNRAASVAVRRGSCSTARVRRLAGAGRPRQPAERGSRQIGGHGRTQAMGANGVDAFQVPQQFRRRTPPRGGAQVLQAGERSVVGREQCRELLSLLVGQGARQTMPEPQIGAVAHTADQALQRGDAGKQHLVRHQPGGCPIEQQSRTVIPGPAEHVEPARQPEASRGVLLQVAKPVALADHRDVAPALPAVAISVEAGRRHLAELTCDGGDHRRRRLGRIVEKGAKEAGGAELDRKADPVMRAAHLTDQFTISGIEVEIAGELLLAGAAGVWPYRARCSSVRKRLGMACGTPDFCNGPAADRGSMAYPLQNSYAKVAMFCDKFRTQQGARA